MLKGRQAQLSNSKNVKVTNNVINFLFRNVKKHLILSKISLPKG